MLQILRNKAQSTVIQAIVVIIALVFIFWGVGTNLMNSRETALTVNGEEITFQEFQQAYDRAYQNLADQFGGNVPKGLAESLNIKQQVINQLIQTALLRQGAQEMGVIVSQEEIQNTIAEMVQFQENGGFSIEKYNTLLSSNRLTPNKFESNMRFDMLSEKTIRDIGNFATLSSDYEVEEIYRQDNEKVSVDFVHVGPENFIGDVQTDDAGLEKWFEEKKDNYRTEPQVELKYLPFTFSGIGSKVTIDATKIAEYYEQNKAVFSTPETRHARHILLTAGEKDSAELHQQKEKRAGEIAALAKADDNFAALAGKYSEGPSKNNGGDLGFFSKGQMVPSFDNAVFSMKAGDVSDVVKTPFGYHIIKLEEITPAATRSLAEVTDEIRAILQNKEAQPLAFQLAGSAYEGIIGAGSLQAYIDAHKDQEVAVTNFFPRSTPPAELAGNERFLDKAFSLKQGELSSLVKTDSGYFIIFANSVKAPEAPPLDQVVEAVTNDFKQAKAVELAETAAGEILEKLKNGASFEDVAKEYDVSLANSGFLGRRDQATSSFPTDLTADVFRLSASEPLPENPGAAGTSYYVFKFAERQIPKIDENTDLTQYRELLLRNKQQELLSAYISNLEKSAEITKHKSL